MLTVAAVLVLGVLAPAPAVPVGSEVEVRSCTGHAFSDLDTTTGWPDLANVVLRRGPHTSCTSDGQGQSARPLDYHCYTEGDPVTRNGVTYTTWTHLRDVMTGQQGWVSNAFLAPNSTGSRGSVVRCP